MKIPIIAVLLLAAAPLMSMEPEKPPKYQQEMTVGELENILTGARQAFARGDMGSYLGQLPKELQILILMYHAYWKTLQEDEEQFFDSLVPERFIKVTKQKARALLKGVALVDATPQQKFEFLKALFSIGLPQVSVAAVADPIGVLEESVEWFGQKLAFKNFQDIANNPELMGKLIAFIKNEVDISYPRIVELLNTTGGWQWFEQEKIKRPEISEA